MSRGSGTEVKVRFSRGTSSWMTCLNIIVATSKVFIFGINGGAITKLRPEGVWGLCMDYVPTYQVHMVKNTTQQQLQSLLRPLRLDMIPGLTSFVDPWGPLKWQNITSTRGGKKHRHTTFKCFDIWIFTVLNLQAVLDLEDLFWGPPCRPARTWFTVC